MVGLVVSDKQTKTVIVQVKTRRRHPLYGKVITTARRFMAHNDEPHAKAGDTVRIIESRPLSHGKRWRVTEIVRHGDVVEAIREKELESLVEKERAEKEARKAEERQRAAERLARLGGFESAEEAEAGGKEPSDFAEEYGESDDEDIEEGLEEEEEE